MTILFIVESKGKIDKITKILGPGFKVIASDGIFRDLDPKPKGGGLSVDVDNNFEPIYVITKPQVVARLKEANKKATEVYIASDLDREGDGIAQSILDVLKPKKYLRLLFDAIDKKTITDAIATAKKTGGEINADRVDAQKARRVLDRLFGYMISGVLQKKVGGKLSAGRTQSVAARMVIDRETEIRNFLEKNQDSSHFKVRGLFGDSLKCVLYKAGGEEKNGSAKNSEKNKNGDKNKKGEKNSEKNKKGGAKINNKIPPDGFITKGEVAHISLVDEDEPNAKVIAFMKRCLKSTFSVRGIDKKTAVRSPAPPFTTSTLQQEAARKLGMSLDSTMSIAQKLYEAGYITYMRTDSVSISTEGHDKLKKVIIKEYGEKYYSKTEYKNKSSASQEAHECCRPVDPEIKTLDDKSDVDDRQNRLYKLIWQRTVASQMAKAKLEITTVQIDISKFVTEEIVPFYYFQSQLEKVVFQGFMKVYVESKDDVEDYPEVNTANAVIPKAGAKIDMLEIVAKQEFLKPPYRFTQASLVKKLTDMKIGRPSTYVNTIKTILDREYVKIGDVKGIKKEITTYTITDQDSKTINEEVSDFRLGQEKNKMFPTSLGIEVNDFLMEHFSNLLDYKFTADMELSLDKIAQGELDWHKLIRGYYTKLKPKVDELSKLPGISKSNEKVLGKDKDGVEIIATKTKFGPVVKKLVDDKYVYAKIREPDTLENITLKKAIELLKFPKLLGTYDNKDVHLHKGVDNYYLKYDNEFYSLPEELSKTGEVSLKEAQDVIKEKLSNRLGEFDIEYKGKKVKAIVLNGPHGPYIQIKHGTKKLNFGLRGHNVEPRDLTAEKIQEIVNAPKKFTRNNSKKSTVTKETESRYRKSAGKKRSTTRTRKQK